jgi:integrase
VPKVKKLPELNVRKGFLEFEDFLRLKDRLPDYLKEAAHFAYLSGWRREAVCSLEYLRDVKLEIVDRTIIGGSVTLQAAFSKNGTSYTLPLEGELLGVIQRAWKTRKSDCAFVFHSDGRRLKYFQRAWKTACKRIARPELLFHDMRRSAARNLVNAGVPERICMDITGHKTRAMFDRYAIVSPDNLSSAMVKVSAYVLDRETNASAPKVVTLRSKAS